ncbi:hypothetical protein BYT27DRAFT_7245242 [Phlegmacium glaucopus]|nr:hypothetical protein BYT27DRAFT_7245242 [Phlegmacium glaucopus]
MAIPIRGVCSQNHSAVAYHALMHTVTNNYHCGFVVWLDYKTNCNTVYYVQVSAPITSFTWVPHDHYLDREVLLSISPAIFVEHILSIQADNNKNIALDKTAAVIGGVVFLAIISTLILRRWKKHSTYPYPYDPVASPEAQIGYVDPIIPTSMTPEKISDVKVGEACSQEDELTGSVRRSSKRGVKKNPSRSTKRRPVAMHPILLLKETEDRSTEEEEYYAPQPSRASRKAKRKSQRRSDRVTHDVDNSMAHIQGLGSASNSPIGLPDGHFPHHASYCPICSPMYTTNPLFVPHNPYHPTHGHTYPLPVGLYGYNMGGPGTNVNSGVGNITHMTISGIGNNSSVNNGYRAPRTRTQRTLDKDESEGYEVCLR